MKDVKAFVRSKVVVEDYTTVPSYMTIGKVYKINNYGDLKKDGYECGFLYLPKGSSVQSHVHENDIEQYVLVSGTLSVDGVIQDENICLLGESHSIDPVPCDTIIATCKINKRLFNLLQIPVSAKAFDWFKQDYNTSSNTEKGKQMIKQ